MTKLPEGMADAADYASGWDDGGTEAGIVRMVEARDAQWAAALEAAVADGRLLTDAANRAVTRNYQLAEERARERDAALSRAEAAERERDAARESCRAADAAMDQLVAALRAIAADVDSPARYKRDVARDALLRWDVLGRQKSIPQASEPGYLPGHNDNRCWCAETDPRKPASAPPADRGGTKDAKEEP